MADSNTHAASTEIKVQIVSQEGTSRAVPPGPPPGPPAAPSGPAPSRHRGRRPSRRRRQHLPCDRYPSNQRAGSNPNSTGIHKSRECQTLSSEDSRVVSCAGIQLHWICDVMFLICGGTLARSCKWKWRQWGVATALWRLSLQLYPFRYPRAPPLITCRCSCACRPPPSLWPGTYIQRRLPPPTHPALRRRHLPAPPRPPKAADLAT